MSKKSNKNKQLRREIEILKAQLKGENVTGKNKSKVNDKNKLPGVPQNNIDQSKSEKNSPVKLTNQKTEGLKKEITDTTVEDSIVKKDLVKTFALSAVAFTIIFFLWILNISNINLFSKIQSVFN